MVWIGGRSIVSAIKVHQVKIYFKPIKGKGKKFGAIADELKKTIDSDVKSGLLKYFERIVESWEHKPQFRAMKRLREGGIAIYVYPIGEHAKIWKYVSQGTRPHKIRPKREGGKLAFPWGGYGSYKPKTSKGGHYKGPGVVVNPQETVLPEVNHPGNEAREFERHIARWFQPEYRRLIRNAIQRGNRR